MGHLLLQFHWDCVEAEDADVFNFQLTEDDMKAAQHSFQSCILWGWLNGRTLKVNS